MQKAWKGRQELSGQEAPIKQLQAKRSWISCHIPHEVPAEVQRGGAFPSRILQSVEGFQGNPPQGACRPSQSSRQSPRNCKRGGSFRPFWVSQKVQKGPGKTLQRFPRHLPLLNVPEGPPQLVLIGARRRSVHPPSCRSSAPSPRPRTAGSSRQTRRRPPRPQRTAQGWPRSRRPPAGAGC